MSFILDLYSYYKKNDKVIEKETFIAGIYGVTMLDLNNHDFIEEIYKTVENRYESLDKKWKTVRLVLIICGNEKLNVWKVNEPKENIK